jgi:hypothetical protein
MLRRSAVRTARISVALAAVMTLPIAAVAGCGSDSSPQSKRARTPTPTADAAATFVSKTLPYQLALPTGWKVDPVSQGAASEEDEFTNAGGTERLIVGHGYHIGNDTVANRVRTNRKAETATGCVSRPKQDRPIEVGGQHGILWSYTCAPDDSHVIPANDAYHLSAQTIYRRAGHSRVGYRFTVVLPLAKKGEAKPLVERFLTGLTFQRDSAATGDE